MASSRRRLFLCGASDKPRWRDGGAGPDSSVTGEDARGRGLGAPGASVSLWAGLRPPCPCSPLQLLLTPVPASLSFPVVFKPCSSSASPRGHTQPSPAGGGAPPARGSQGFRGCAPRVPGRGQAPLSRVCSWPGSRDGAGTEHQAGRQATQRAQQVAPSARRLCAGTRHPSLHGAPPERGCPEAVLSCLVTPACGTAWGVAASGVGTKPGCGGRGRPPAGGSTQRRPLEPPDTWRRGRAQGAAAGL